jgi:hypothetical protein
MPDITIVKLKIRRGTDNQRKLITLEQGELGYTTDKKRVYIGDGSTVGGNILGNFTWPPVTTLGETRVKYTNAVKGDIVNDHGLLYQFTGTSPVILTDWTYIGSAYDNSSIVLDANNALKINSNGITGSMFDSSAATGGLVATITNGISANVDNSTIKVNGSNQLYVDSIDSNLINAYTIGNGLSGGSGQSISLRANSTTFSFDNTGTLQLTAVPANTVNVYALSAASLGTGLQVTGDKLVTTIQGVDATLSLVSNTLGLPSVAAGYGTPAFWKGLTFDQYGRVQTTTNTIFTTLTANNAGVLSAFNGAPNQNSRGYPNNGLRQSIIPVLSSDGTTTTTLRLSSAGFIAFTSTSSLCGQEVNRFAIPVYTY